jgi:hypothetical protein
MLLPDFLTVKHRRHRINFIRNGLYCYFSYANKFGEFIHLLGHSTSSAGPLSILLYCTVSKDAGIEHAQLVFEKVVMWRIV